MSSASSGSPDELYDAPANEFVFRFLGDATQLGDRLVRPHDIDISTQAHDGSLSGTVVRLLRVGFEVRVEVDVAGQTVNAIVTRAQHRSLDLEIGDRVWLRVSPDAAGANVAPAALRNSA